MIEEYHVSRSTPNLRKQFRGYMRIGACKKYHRLNIREDSEPHAVATTASPAEENRNFTGANSGRDLPIKTYHALARDKRDIYTRGAR